MNIYTSYHLYTGAYAEKNPLTPTVRQPSEPPVLTKAQKQSLQKALQEAAVSYRLFGEDYDYATISEEGRGFVIRDEIVDPRKQMDPGEYDPDALFSKGDLITMDSFDIESMYRKLAVEANQQIQAKHLGESDELLWGCSGNQWLLFSQTLYDHGYYDDLSADEAREIDHMLCSITSSMDGYRRLKNWGHTQMHSVDENGILSASGRDTLNYYDISSYGMQFMLESSTAALQYFSENYIEDDALREKFQSLIDMYHTSNAEQIAGHHSWEEAMGNFRWKFLGYQEIMKQFGAEMIEQERRESAASGIVTPTETETNDYLSQLSSLFSQLKEGTMDFQKIWGKIADTYADYASKGNHNHSRLVAIKQAGDSLKQMKQMWADLIKEYDEGSLNAMA